jgi:hypothetical protein
MKRLLLLLLFCTGLVKAQTVYIPDVAFKNYLKNNTCSNTTGLAAANADVDTNNNGEIEVSEALAVKTLVVGAFPETTITNLQGLEAFTNLERITLQTSNALWADYNLFPNLIYLKHNAKPFNTSLITWLKVAGLSNLKYIILGSGRNVSEFYPITALTSLEELDISGNIFNSNTFDNLPPSLKKLKIQNNCSSCAPGANSLEGIIDFSYLVNLVELDIYNNEVTDLILNLPNLTTLNCDGNAFVNLDLFNLPSLVSVRCQGNDLVSVNLKDGVHNNLSTLLLMEQSSFKYICKDEDDIIPATTLLTTNYCTIYPSNYRFDVHGSNKLDLNNNGCSATDTNFPNLRFSVLSDGTLESVIADVSGSYHIPVLAGIHTITPVLENPAFYNVAPASVQVEFSAISTPAVQNFCITPNGNHQDLEVVLIPTSPARPGFNATYNLVYRNKGNQSISGHADMDYSGESNVMEFVSAAPAASTAAPGLLTWNFTNLAPFETRAVLISFHLNSPSDVPPLVAGDQLGMQAIIYPLTNDEITADNYSNLKQLVVNAYDPNDKTGLEGDAVGSYMIGNYVHYVIRFENTGTFPAENVIVKDMIDTSKFDVGSLVPLFGSHSYVTRVTDTNKVEFIFENINLSFDPATNKGYFAFKIRLKDNLAVGDIFTNQASIYFDYNLPIVTNNESTIISALARPDFTIDNPVLVYPNPAKNNLTVNADYIRSIQLYDVQGRVLETDLVGDAEFNMDISKYANGVYFLKITTDKGIKTQRILKE